MTHAVAVLWSSMWPNIFAPSFFTVLGIALSHVRLKRHHDRRHEELKAHFDKKGSHG